jgi:hypothetical protein
MSGMLARVVSKIPLLDSVLKKARRQRKSLTFLKRNLCAESNAYCNMKKWADKRTLKDCGENKN